MTEFCNATQLRNICSFASVCICNEGPHDLCSSPDNVRLTKQRETLFGHVKCIGREDKHIQYWRGNMRERNHLKDLGVDGMIIFKWILKK